MNVNWTNGYGFLMTRKRYSSQFYTFDKSLKIWKKLSIEYVRELNETIPIGGPLRLKG